MIYMSKHINLVSSETKIRGLTKIVPREVMRLPFIPKKSLEGGICEDCRNFSYDLVLAENGLFKCRSCAEV